MAYYTADDGCRIYYELFGNCGPRVVLIPGLGGDGRFWSGVVSELCDDFSLIVVDHRGAGRSDRPQSVYSIGRIAADIAGVCASECGNAHFVGHSTGGAIAQTLALDHPQLGLSYTISSSWARADERFRSLFKARLELLENGLTEAYQRLTHVFGHETSYLEAHSERLADAVCAATEVLAPLPVAAARVRMLLDHDRLSELARLIAPVHVIAADSDILTPPEMSEIIASAVSGARLTRLAGAHFHPLTRPEQFAVAFRGFLGEICHDR